MIKTIFKLVLLIGIHALIFMIGNSVMPFSPGFKELGTSSDPMGLLFLLINSGWACFTIYFIIRHTHYRGRQLFFNLLFIMFFVQCFMTQIETLFFGNAFPVLTKIDIILIMLASLLPLLAVIPLTMKLFITSKEVKDENTGVIKQPFLDIKCMFIRFGIIGVIYLFVYMIFGYFIAWQFEELRIFYTGSSEKLGFFGQLLNNLLTNPVIYPFQIIRGILFSLFIFPLVKMVNKNKTVFITSVGLVYLSTAVLLIIPNVLFPDMVRYGHLIEMTSSMLLFGIIAGNIMWRNKK
ncbi:MAG: hypothetical protein FWD40_04680 [Treponema sp.]|nr:hypothetical protein [Treponema sp.]